MATSGGPADDVEGSDTTDDAPVPVGTDRSLAPQPGRSEPSAPDDDDLDAAPEQARQSQQ